MHNSGIPGANTIPRLGLRTGETIYETYYIYTIIHVKINDRRSMMCTTVQMHDDDDVDVLSVL